MYVWRPRCPAEPNRFAFGGLKKRQRKENEKKKTPATTHTVATTDILSNWFHVLVFVWMSVCARMCVWLCVRVGGGTNNPVTEHSWWRHQGAAQTTPVPAAGTKSAMRGRRSFLLWRNMHPSAYKSPAKGSRLPRLPGPLPAAPPRWREKTAQ